MLRVNGHSTDRRQVTNAKLRHTLHRVGDTGCEPERPVQDGVDVLSLSDNPKYAVVKKNANKFPALLEALTRDTSQPVPSMKVTVSAVPKPKSLLLALANDAWHSSSPVSI